MKPEVNPEEEGPMDKSVQTIRNEKNSQRPILLPVEKGCDKLVTSTLCIMPLAQRQLGSASAPSQPPDKQEKKPHATHSFKWCWDGILSKSSKTLRLLATNFTDLVKGTKFQIPGPSLFWNHFHVEYGKNDQTCREVKTMKKLMELSDSVCQVRINGRAGGSGFLLFDKFVLTNGHVIKNVYHEKTRQLTERVTVDFSYEMEGGQDSGAEVEEVVGFEYCSDETELKYDWALLRLSAEQNLPDGLLKHFGSHFESRQIYIIGHPDGRVKMIEPCLIVPFDNRSQVVERHYRENPQGVWVDTSIYGQNPGHFQWVTPSFFQDVERWVKQRKHVLTYESSFYFGTSGSPIIDQHCNVVAMHSGGYMYWKESGQCQSVIEYGYPLSAIIEQASYQLVERGRFDVLNKLKACMHDTKTC